LQHQNRDIISFLTAGRTIRSPFIISTK